MSGRSMTRCVKVSLVLVNVLIFLSGLIMLIGGSVVQHQINSEYLSKKIGGFTTQAGSIICIIFGLFVLVFAVFGLFASIKDHQRFLMLYAGVMSLVFIIQFITGIVGLSVKNGNNFTNNVSEIVRPMFQFNRTTFETDFYQKTFKCCGWTGYSDYVKKEGNETVSLISKSCCKDASACNETLVNGDPGKYAFNEGCQFSLVKTFSKVIEASCGILITMSLLTLLSIALSIVLSRSITTGYQFS